MKTDKRNHRSSRNGNRNDNDRKRSKDDERFSHSNKRGRHSGSSRYYNHNSYVDLDDPNNIIVSHSIYPKKRRDDNYDNAAANEDHRVSSRLTRSGSHQYRKRKKAKNKIALETLPRFRGTAKLDKSNPHVEFNNDRNVPPSGSVLKEIFERDVQKNAKVHFGVNNSPSKCKLVDDVTPDLSIFEMNTHELFQWLLYPVLPATFNKDYWEKFPLFVSRDRPDHYKDLNVNTATVDALLRENHVLFGKNIDITTYIDGVRETHNPAGRAQAHIVWDFFKNGCSVRLLNPQTFINSVYRLNEKLQTYFNGFVGANLYLTPPKSQGFAPHYDDIEAFVLQLQGCKYWKIYRPRMKSEELPRYSSPNFTEDEVGEPILEIALKPGDILYFPRGYIHQASTQDELSLHITLSAYQHTAYVDLLEKLLPDALSKAAQEHEELRQGLPLDYAQHFGSAILKSSKKEKRIAYKEKILSLINKVLDHLNVDSAVDNLAAHRLHDQLPPYFSEDEKNKMVFKNRTKLNEDGKTVNVIQLELSTFVKLTSPHICRLVKADDGRYLLYHSVNNSMEYHGNEEEFLEVPEESVVAFKRLYAAYPAFVRVKKLPIADDEAKWSFANSLWEVGLLRTRNTLKGIKTNFVGNDDESVENESDDDGNSHCQNDDDDDDDNDENDDEVFEDCMVENENVSESEVNSFPTADNTVIDVPLLKPADDRRLAQNYEDSYIDVVSLNDVTSHRRWSDNNIEDCVILD